MINRPYLSWSIQEYMSQIVLRVAHQPLSWVIKEKSSILFVRDLTRLGTSWYLTCSIAWIYFLCWPSRYSSQVMSLRDIFAHIHNWLWNTILHRLIKSAIKSNNCQHSVINFQHKRCDYNNNDKFYLHLGMCCVIHQLGNYDTIFWILWLYSYYVHYLISRQYSGSCFN